MTIMKLTRKANQPGFELEGLVPAVLAREVLATADLTPAEGHIEPIRQAVSEGHKTAALIFRHYSERIFSANSATAAERDLAVLGAVHTVRRKDRMPHIRWMWTFLMRPKVLKKVL